MKNFFAKKSMILQAVIPGFFLFFSHASQAAEWQKIELPQPSATVLQGRGLFQCELKSFPSAQRLFYGCRLGNTDPATKTRPYDYWVVELDNQGKKKQEWVIKNVNEGNKLFSALIIAADNQDFYLALTELDDEANKKKRDVQVLSSWLIKTLKIYRVSKNNKQEAIDYGWVTGSLKTLPAIMVQPSGAAGKRPACLWIAIERPSEASDNNDGAFFEIVEQCYDRKGKERLRIVTEWKANTKSGWYELSFLSSDGGSIQVGGEKFEIGAKKAAFQSASQLWHYSLIEGNPSIWEQQARRPAGSQTYTYAKPILANDIYGLNGFFYRNLRDLENAQTHIIVPHVSSKTVELLIHQQPKSGAQPSTKAEWPMIGKIDLTKLLARYQLAGAKYLWDSSLIQGPDKGWVLVVSQLDGATSMIQAPGMLYTFLLKADGSLIRELPAVKLSHRRPSDSNIEILPGLNDRTAFLLLTGTAPNDKLSLWRLQLDQ
ncbi:MAG TPA: hypothetical protein PK803_05490 [Alphaproteobacteria bacterium]|nr:hypothetical protein [Alphaproteobacteria bacterium]